MAEPPLLLGAVHDKSIWVRPLAVALRPVGAPGAPALACVVASAMFDTGPVPAELIADTR